MGLSKWFRDAPGSFPDNLDSPFEGQLEFSVILELFQSDPGDKVAGHSGSVEHVPQIGGIPFLRPHKSPHAS